jgi:hypothetical protein
VCLVACVTRVVPAVRKRSDQDALDAVEAMDAGRERGLLLLR